MSYLIFNAETRIIVKEGFKTEKGAKNVRTRLLKTERYAGKLLEVCDRKFFDEHVEEMVERTNLLTGKKYMEARNTPSCCSPSSESYWSA